MTGTRLSLDSLTLTDTAPQVAIRAAAQADTGIEVIALEVFDQARAAIAATRKPLAAL